MSLQSWCRPQAGREGTRVWVRVECSVQLFCSVAILCLSKISILAALKLAGLPASSAKHQGWQRQKKRESGLGVRGLVLAS